MAEKKTIGVWLYNAWHGVQYMHLKYCGVQESSITQYKYQLKPSHLDTSLKQGRYTAWEYKDEDG